MAVAHVAGPLISLSAAPPLAVGGAPLRSQSAATAGVRRRWGAARSRSGLLARQLRNNLATAHMGSSSLLSARLVDPKTGKLEPGWSPGFEVLTTTMHATPADSWAVVERGPARALAGWGERPNWHMLHSPSGPISDRRQALATRVIPYDEVYRLVYSSWDRKHTDDPHTPVGMEFDDEVSLADQHTREFLRRMSPRSVGLHTDLCHALATMGITHLTTGQSDAFPDILAGKDVMLATHPGSGKTLMAVCHIVDKQLKEYPNAPFSTVWLTPTEALARQTVRWLHALGRMSGTVDPDFAALCVNSKDLKQNYDEVLGRRPSVLVGTAERLGDLMHSYDTPLWDLQQNTLQRIVVDEVDTALPHQEPRALGNCLMKVISRHPKAPDKADLSWGNRPQQKIFMSSGLDYATKLHISQWWRKSKGKYFANYRGRYQCKVAGAESGMPNPVTSHTEHALEDRRRRDDHGGQMNWRPWHTIGLPPNLTHCSVPCGSAEQRWDILGALALHTARRQNEQWAAARGAQAAAAAISSGGDPAAPALPPTSPARAGGAAAGAERRPGGPPAIQKEAGQVLPPYPPSVHPDSITVPFRGLVVVDSAAAAAAAGAALSAAGFKGKVARLEHPQALRLYSQGDLPMLIALPKHVRGIDIPYLTHIFICCRVRSPADYIHLAGRVGRASRSGVVVTLCEPGDWRSLRYAQQTLNAEAHVAEVNAETRCVELPLSVPAVVYGGEGRLELGVGEPDERPPPPLRVMRAFLVDDPKAVDLLSDGKGESPGVPQVFDQERNIFMPDGTVRPKIEPRLWPGGSSHRTLFTPEEQKVMEEQNHYEYYEGILPEDKRGGVSSGAPSGELAPMPGGSLLPPGKQRGLEGTTGRADPAAEQDLASRTGPQRESMLERDLHAARGSIYSQRNDPTRRDAASA